MPLRLSGLPAMIVPLTPERVLLQASNPPSASCGRSSRLRAAAFKAFRSSGFSRLSTELPNPRHWACEYAGHKEKDASLERGEAGEDSPSALSPLKWTGFLRSLIFCCGRGANF